MRNAVLVASFLLCCGAVALIYINKRVSPGRNPLAGSTFQAPDRQPVRIPALPFLSPRLLSKEAVSISRERNADVLQGVFEVFDPSLRSILSSVPIVEDPSADTAKAYPALGYIGVSPDWDNTVLQSRYRETYEQRGMKPDDPVFENRFKTDLLIHEFLHILQVRQGIGSRPFFEAVERWYLDPRYGIPSPNGIVHAGHKADSLTTNRLKYVLWHELYNYRGLSDPPRHGNWKNMIYRKRYRRAEKGVEEFAYIGQEILSTGSSSGNFIKTGRWSDKDWKEKKMRLQEVSPEVISFYRGVFNPDLMR
jgi:hypothetical protein